MRKVHYEKRIKKRLQNTYTTGHDHRLLEHFVTEKAIEPGVRFLHE